MIERTKNNNEQLQSDFEQYDSTKPDYIKNRPVNNEVEGMHFEWRFPEAEDNAIIALWVTQDCNLDGIAVKCDNGEASISIFIEDVLVEFNELDEVPVNTEKAAIYSTANNSVKYGNTIKVVINSLSETTNRIQGTLFIKGIKPDDILIPIEAIASGNGSTTGSGNYHKGETAILNAIPDEGAEFVSWTDDGEIVSTEPEYTFNVLVNKTLIAEFSSKALELTFDSIENVPIEDPENVDQWNTFFDLPANGNPFTSVEVEAVEGGKVNYGLLYNFYAATDARKITSDGDFVLPTYNDFNILMTYTGGQSTCGGKLKESGFIYWDNPNTGATNEVYFNAKGSGGRGDLGEFGMIKQYTAFITTTTEEGMPIIFELGFNVEDLQMSNMQLYYGMSIRLIRPATTPELSLADGASCAPYIGNDGKVYRTVKIGSQVWLADNLAETKFRNGDWIHGFDDGVYTSISNEDWAALTTAACCAYNDDLGNAYSSNCKIKLYGGSEITIKEYLMSDVVNWEPYTNILYIDDKAGSIKEIKGGAFYNCSNLIYVSFPSCNKTYCTDDGNNLGCFQFSGLEAVYLPSLTEIADKCFYECLNLSSFDFSIITKIGKASFVGCAFTNISLPICVIIDDYAFSDNTYLTSFHADICINFGIGSLMMCALLSDLDILFDEITTIPEQFLAGCESLTVLSFNNATVLGRNCFQNCSGLIELNLPYNDILVLNEQTLAGTIFETFSFPNAISAKENCFEAALCKDVNLPLVESIGNLCFRNCTELETLYIPSCAQIGESVGDNLVFEGISGQTITLTVPAALMTCNGGNPDGDILYLQSNNTVTIITT